VYCYHVRPTQPQVLAQPHMSPFKVRIRRYGRKLATRGCLQSEMPFFPETMGQSNVSTLSFTPFHVAGQTISANRRCTAANIRAQISMVFVVRYACSHFAILWRKVTSAESVPAAVWRSLPRRPHEQPSHFFSRHGRQDETCVLPHFRRNLSDGFFATC
jgi:hypothetical protein